MKCEICHQAEAETALVRGEGEGAEELYVCKACAKSERQRRQKKSQRTRKSAGLPPGVSMTITRIGPGGDGEKPPPFIEAIMNAVDGMVSDIEKSAAAKPRKGERKPRPVSLEGTDPAFMVGGGLHLEGLHLIGEVDAVRRAMHALDMDLVGCESGGVVDPGHVFGVASAAPAALAGRVVKDLLREERNARVRLFEEMPRVFGDALCRALAILKNARLLSPAELFDLLSPMRLAALEGMLDGVSLKDVEEMLESAASAFAGDEKMDADERDREDAERADEMNRRFEDVVLNERAEEKFL